MDVLEHVPNPLDLLMRAAALLRETGIVLLQTPCYPEGASLGDLRAAKHRFLEHLHAEHLHLFSKTAVKKLCAAAGLSHIVFLPAVFEHYDLFAIAAGFEPAAGPPNELIRRLTASPSGRMIDALLQKDDAVRSLASRLAGSAADGEARLRVIEEQGRRLEELDAERNNLRGELEDLRRHFEASEADREARLRVIEEQGRRLGELDAERNNLRGELEDLRRHFEASEADREARLRVIEEQGRRLGEAERDLAGARERLAAQLQRNAELALRLDGRDRFLSSLFQSRLYRLLRRTGVWKWPEPRP